jgi:hypothetical protein
VAIDPARCELTARFPGIASEKSDDRRYSPALVGDAPPLRDDHGHLPHTPVAATQEDGQACK